MRFLLLFVVFVVSGVNSSLLSTENPYEELNAVKKRETNATIVHDPAIPFARYGVVYYWHGNYKHSPSAPKKCIFLQKHPEWPFGEHVHPNGTAVPGVEFGCTRDDVCKKYRCDKSIASGLVWCAFLLVSSMISVGIIIRYVVGRRSEEHRGNDDEGIEMRSVYIPVVVVNRESNGHLEVPPLFPTN